MDMDELIAAVKEAVEEQLQPFEDRIVKLEADAAALNQGMKALGTNVDEFKEGVDKVVGGSKAIIGQDGDDGGVATKSNDKPRRDAWGRRTRS